jgi:hypothetical protein
VESEELRADGRPVYRYWLERRWSNEPHHLLWVMFNPSRATADGTDDDRAVAACLRRTKHFASANPDLGVGAMRMANLFARRATDVSAEEWPRGDALNSPQWCGPDNDAHLAEQAADPRTAEIIVAWGPTLVHRKQAQRRAIEVADLLGNVLCLGQDTKSQQPYYAGPRSRYPISAPLHYFTTTQ